MATRDRQQEGARFEEAPVERTTLVGRVRLIVGLVALAALVLFLLQNLQDVEVHFLWFDWSTRLLWALLVSAIVGALAAVVLGTLVRRRER